MTKELNTTAPPGVASSSQLPAEWLDEAARDAGLGVSTKSEDQIIPLLNVLQTGSPICNKRGEAHVEGAEAGKFWLRGALSPIRDGLTGIEAIPCGMVRKWVEFLQARGGYVGEHEKPPADVEPRISTDENGNEKTVQVRRGNGNLIVDTRQVYLLIEGAPWMLPCYGTRHTFARLWQTYFNQLRHPKTGGILPSFTHRYLLTTVPDSNTLGSWFGLKFTDLGEVTGAEYAAGKRFCQAVACGSARGEAITQDTAA
jgi:hypothetical protein